MKSTNGKAIQLSETEKVTQAFLAEINSRGIVHVFEWMHGWFDRVAEASVKDEMNKYLDPHAQDHTAQNLYLMDRMMNMAGQISNHSTSASSNLMRQARVSAMAQMIERNYHGYASGHERRQKWDEWNALPEVAQKTAEHLEQAQRETVKSKSK